MDRKTIIKTFLTTATMLLILTVTLADTTIVNKPTPQLTVATVNSPSIQETMTESEAYKLLYDNAKESNDRMVTTIQWVIGISLAFLLAILGSQIFFNWKINTKEIDYIKKDIEEKILTLKAELIASVETKSKEIQATIDKKVYEAEAQLKTDIKDKFESRIKFFDLKSDATERRIESEVKQIKIELEKNSGDIWLLKGVEANALSSYLRTATLQIELKREVKYILDDIISILSKLDEIHETDYNNLNELTNSLTASHKEQKEKIISLYKDKPVYRFNERRNPFGYGTGLLSFGIGGLSGKEYVKNKPK